ncbi:MAG: hypothetical protein LC800_07660, partial [Acidobacteria bacterium]|nr:hypothetical protein [Acidobacteriota bacterium]
MSRSQLFPDALRRAVALALLAAFVFGPAAVSPRARAQEPAKEEKKEEGEKKKEEKKEEGLPLKPEGKVEFATDEGTWMSVDLSPDGGSIVFDLLGDIYT